MKHLWILAPLLLVASGSPARRPPNILVIVADDLGYGDLGCHGGKDIPTPNIDSIAASGVRCTSGYVSGPYCSPTRAGLLTGRYQQRYGHEFNPGPPSDANVEVGLSLAETTLADRLKAAGYATGMVGKWHLGHAEKFNPVNRGFQEYFGFLGGAHAYHPGGKADGANSIMRGTKPVEEPEYLTDAFGREAVAYIDRHQKDPFFLYLTFNAVHTPMQAPPKVLERFAAGIADEKRRTYAAMLASMDDAVGAVLAKLRATGLEEQTLIFFVSDNGGPTGANASRNTPLSGNKSSTWEGGIRVPFLMQWKGTLPAGKVYEQPVIQLDIHPTALAAAGAPMPAEKPLDGVDLLPFLSGKKEGAPHAALFWRFGDQTAVRAGNFKLLGQKGAQQLFDLSADIGETKDLSAQQPEKLKELKAAYDAWNAGLVAPAWGKGKRKST